MVAQMLRWGQVTGLRISLPESQQQCRIVVYCDTQPAPVYVSQVLGTLRGELVVDDLEFVELPPQIARSQCVCIRVFGVKILNGNLKSNNTKHSAEPAGSVALLAESTINLKSMVPGSANETLMAIAIESQTFIQGNVPPGRTSSHHSLAAAALRQTIGKKPQGPAVTPNFDIINKVMLLQAAIDDAEMAKRRAKHGIDELLKNAYTPLNERLKALQSVNQKTKELIHFTQSRVKQTKDSTQVLKSEREAHTVSLQESLDILRSMEVSPPPPDLEPKILAQQSRIANILLEIFPIDIPADPREQLTICGLPLPAMFLINHFNPVQVGAALGLVAQLVIILSRYLDVPLPYPVQPLGSQSYIINPLIHTKGSNIFPLWTNGTLLYRLEYGLYLLRQDVQLLLSSRQLAVVSPFQVLANLKNLMLVVGN